MTGAGERLAIVAVAARLGWRRAWLAPGRWAGAAAGIALAVGLLGALSAGGVVAGDHAARRTIAALPADRRPVRLSWDGGAPAGVDRAARTALERMGAGTVTRSLLLSTTRIADRGTARLGAIASPGRWLRLSGGRLPRGRCTPTHCEVVAIAGPLPPRRLAGREVRLTVVGRGAVTSSVALGFRTAGPSPRAHGPVMVVSGDPAGVDELSGLSAVYRTQTWSAGLPLADLHSWQLGPELDRVRAALDGLDPDLTPTAPTATLAAAGARADAAPGRLRAAGAAAAAALLAFVVLAAGALRRGLLAEDARLRRNGASAPQRGALVLAETGVSVLAGAVAGALLAVFAALGRAAAGGVDGGHVLAVTLRGEAVSMGAVLLAGWAAIGLAARAPAGWGRPLAAGGSLGALALLAGVLLSRTGATSDPLPAAVIPMAGAAAGLLLACVLPAVLQGLARAAPSSRPHVRLSLLELARAPGPSTLAAAGLTVAVGLGGFAFAYRATLDRSRTDQAAHRVPLDAMVTPGPSLASPLDVRTRASWAALPGAAAALPVLRRSASWVVGPDSAPVTLLGVPARAGLVPSPPPAAAEERGLPLPSGVATVGLRARSTVAMNVVAVVRRPGGGPVDTIALGTAGPVARRLHGPVPAADRGGTVIAIEVEPPDALLATAGHAAAEGGSGSEISAGSATLGGLRAGSASTSLRGWRGHASARGPATALRVAFGGQVRGVIRPSTPTDRAPLPVRVDARTAAAIGVPRFVVDVLGVSLPVRVAGIVGRVPTVAVGHPVVLADVTALRDALDAAAPGTGDEDELWLRARDPVRLDAVLGGVAGRSGLELRTRAGVRATLEAEPVTREVLGALLAAALLAAAVAAAGVAITVRRALRDDADALLDLEAQGVGPVALRRALRGRGVAVAILGIVPGLGFAVVLTRLVAGAVRAGTGGSPPDPPLVTTVPFGAGLAAAAALLAVAAVLTVLVTATALRETVPRATAGAGG